MMIPFLRGLRLDLSSSGLRVLFVAALAMGAAACNSGSGGAGAGGGAGSTNPGGTAGAGAGGSEAKACDSPTPILQPDGSDSGYVKCADGAVNRVAKVVCVLQNVDTCEGTEEILGCTTAADCTDKPNGVCAHILVEGPGGGTCGCVYPCETDDDCGGNACVCAGVSAWTGTKENSFCAQSSDCTQPSDCASGQCGLGEWRKNCFMDAHTGCRAADDACRTDPDCDGTGSSPQCEKTDATGTWKCNDPTCTI